MRNLLKNHRVIKPLLALMGWSYAILPYFITRWMIELVTVILLVIKPRKKTVLENLQKAKMDLSFYQVYKHLAHVVIEICMLFDFSDDEKAGAMTYFVKRRVKLEGLDNLDYIKNAGKPVIFLASHMGNWEVMASSAAKASVRMLMVTKKLKPLWLHQSIERSRRFNGSEATYEPKTLKDVLRVLNKQSHYPGIVIDQFVGPPVGVRVPFFGVSVGTQPLIAFLVKRTGALVLPVRNFRNKDGTFVLRFEPVIPWVEDAHPRREIAINTKRYSDHIETWIRQNPDQWLWVHKRFKGDLSALRPGEWEESRTRDFPR